MDRRILPLVVSGLLVAMAPVSAVAQNFTSNVTITTNDAPLLQLNQTAAIFDPYTWEVAGNESNFFIRDVTGGNTRPFGIVSEAPTTSLVVAGNGDIGVGTGIPEQKVHVVGSAPQILVERFDPGAGVLFKLANTAGGNVRFELQNGNNSWTFNNIGNAFTITKAGTGTAQLRVDSQGDTTVLGNMTADAYFTSSRAR